VRPCGSVPPGRGGKRTVGEQDGPQEVGAQPTLQGGHADHRARVVGERARAAPRGTHLKGCWACGRWSAVHLINVRRNGHNRSHNVMLRFVGSSKIVASPGNFRGVEGVPKGPGTGVTQAHDWPRQWHGRQSAVHGVTECSHLIHSDASPTNRMARFHDHQAAFSSDLNRSVETGCALRRPEVITMIGPDGPPSGIYGHRDPQPDPFPEYDRLVLLCDRLQRHAYVRLIPSCRRV